MKAVSLLCILAAALVSCSKSSQSDPAPDPVAPVNNGPIGGTYTFTSLTEKTYDTIPGTGILTTHEYTTTTTNHSGSLVITAGTITSKGLMDNYVNTGTRKETNTTTGAVVTTNLSPTSGSSGAASTNYSSTYSIDTAVGELTISNAQYLFNPAFIMQPGNNKHSYTLTGNTLKVITNSYSASGRTRTISEATFTKQ
jgi:hypothetical protein